MACESAKLRVKVACMTVTRQPSSEGVPLKLHFNKHALLNNRVTDRCMSGSLFGDLATSFMGFARL